MNRDAAVNGGGSCLSCWPFLCPTDENQGKRRCMGTCGLVVPLAQLRRRSHGWFCRDCDAAR
jgi:hypothetical protein